MDAFLTDESGGYGNTVNAVIHHPDVTFGRQHGLLSAHLVKQSGWKFTARTISVPNKPSILQDAGEEGRYETHVGLYRGDGLLQSGIQKLYATHMAIPQTFASRLKPQAMLAQHSQFLDRQPPTQVSPASALTWNSARNVSTMLAYIVTLHKPFEPGFFSPKYIGTSTATTHSFPSNTQNTTAQFRCNFDHATNDQKPDDDPETSN